MSLRIVFAGTPEFAVPALAAVIAAGHRVCAVYTQPDRPAGRGRIPRSSPVKNFALKQGLAVRQPPSLEHQSGALRTCRPDLMVVVAYGLMLPKGILQVPKHGCINVHASLLPRWRGAAPIQRAIEAGDPVTGVTIMQMDEGLDTGDILAQVETPIYDSDTAQDLHDRLAALGARTLVQTLERLERGLLKPRPQDETAATYAPKLSKREAAVDWRQPAAVIARKVRALNPWPVANTTHHGRVLRLWETTPEDTDVPGKPGTILGADPRGIMVRAGKGSVCIRRLQAPGGRPLTAADFLNGYPLQAGDILGDVSADPSETVGNP